MGPPWLATAGAGDVLAGLCGSLLAAGLSPFDAGSVGSWLHGAAAVVAGHDGPVTAPEVARALPAVLRTLLRLTRRLGAADPADPATLAEKRRQSRRVGGVWGARVAGSAGVWEDGGEMSPPEPDAPPRTARPETVDAAPGAESRRRPRRDPRQRGDAEGPGRRRAR